MKAEVEKEYRDKLRDFMQRKGRAVKFTADKERHPDWPEHWVSPYGWTDFDAERHIHPWEATATPCSWVVPEGAELVEQTYSQFAGTFTDNDQEVGINVTPCHCACGKFTDVTLRFAGSLTEVLHDLLGVTRQTRFTL